MSKIKVLGLWKEFGWDSSISSIHNEEILPKNTIQTEFKILDYLKGGTAIIATRGPSQCIFTNEDMGISKIYTDGEITWTTPYLFYLKKGRIMPKQALLEHI